MEIIFFICGAILFIAFKLLTSMPCIPSNPKQLYVKKAQPKKEKNESIVKPVFPVRGTPEDSEGEEKCYSGFGVWL